MPPNLLDKRVLFVTGKGGVGKSTVSCALALCAARRNKRVLLVETGSRENMSYIFGTDPVGYEPRALYPNVAGMYLEPYEALTEFLAHEIKIKMLARGVVNNRLFRYLAEVAPGWRELITLGKVWTRETAANSRTGKPEHDLIIVDAPATGHGISFLRVPQVLLDTLAFGPVKRYTQEVQNLLTDETRTALTVVTLAEEMPVNETVELIEATRKQMDMALGAVFANAVYPKVFLHGQKGKGRKFFENETAVARLDEALGKGVTADDVKRCAESLSERRALNEKYLKKLEERLGVSPLVLPYVFTDYFDVRDLEELASNIDAVLEET